MDPQAPASRCRCEEACTFDQYFKASEQASRNTKDQFFDARAQTNRDTDDGATSQATTQSGTQDPGRKKKRNRCSSPSDRDLSVPRRYSDIYLNAEQAENNDPMGSTTSMVRRQFQATLDQDVQYEGKNREAMASLQQSMAVMRQSLADSEAPAEELARDRPMGYFLDLTQSQLIDAGIPTDVQWAKDGIPGALNRLC